MLISILFVSIIIVYGFIGLKKGGIKSIGGLISMILSFILSRCLAIPVTQYIIDIPNRNHHSLLNHQNLYFYQVQKSLLL